MHARSSTLVRTALSPAPLCASLPAPANKREAASALVEKARATLVEFEQDKQFPQSKPILANARAAIVFPRPPRVAVADLTR